MNIPIKHIPPTTRNLNADLAEFIQLLKQQRTVDWTAPATVNEVIAEYHDFCGAQHVRKMNPVSGLDPLSPMLELFRNIKLL